MWVSFKKSVSGNVAGLFAVSCSIIAIGIGAAIDYNYLVNNQIKTQNALDMAVVAAAGNFQKDGSKPVSKSVAKTMFEDNCSAVGCKASAKVRIMVDNDGTVTGTVDSQLEPLVMGLIGYSSMNYTNIAEARMATTSTYRDMYFVLDWSASLGIAATIPEREALKALTKPYVSPFPGAEDGCAFACHQSEFFIRPEVGGVEVTTYEFAKANGINLREDVLLEKVTDIVGTINDNYDSSVRTGVYVMSDSLEEVIAPSSSTPWLASDLAAANMEHRGTRFDIALPQLAGELGMSGDGSTSTKAIKSIVLVTDGLNNNYDAGIITSTFKAEYCGNLKANGVKIAILHLRYPDLTGQPWYDYFAAPHLPGVTPALQACADDGFYFEAESASEIADALELISGGLGAETTKKLALTK